LPCINIGITPEFTKRAISKRKNKMSERNEKQTSELSMDELDNVAGGASTNVKGIDIVVRKKTGGGLTTDPTADSGAAAATGTSGGN